MGLIKLALIGGAAYYAGKKFNEGHHGENGQQGYQGGCWRRKQMKQQQQQQQQQQYDYQHGQGMPRDMQYPSNGYEYSEKAPLPMPQREYPNEYGNDHGHGWGYAYQPEHPQDTKPQLQPRKSREMIRVDHNMDNTNTDTNVPPAYVGYDGQRLGYGGRQMSPQQRMYPGQTQPRSGSPVAQQVFVDPRDKERERGTIEKLMWK